MEKTSIGAFIAALRRASGMTQRQLGERLGVSDKTVSRWERDETAPDLSLIPVIAELFGITSDELLRGRRNAEQSAPCTPAGQEKRLERMLNQTRLQFRIQTVLNLSLMAVGILAALVATRYWGAVGFLLGLVCYLGAGVSTVISVLKANAGLEAEEFDCDRVRLLKQSILDSGCSTGILLIGITAGTALLLNSSLDLGEVLLLGSPLAAGVVYGGLLLKWFLFLPRREESALHELRVSTASNIAAVVGVALMFGVFFWMAFEWDAALMVGLVFTALAIPIGLCVYLFKKKKI